jgi:hypothetical protein
MTFDTFTGNNDGIGGKNDVLRLTVDSSTGGRFHLVKGIIETDTVTNHEVTFDYLTGGGGFANKFFQLGSAFASTLDTTGTIDAKIVADTTWRSVTLKGKLTSSNTLVLKICDGTAGSVGILGSSVAGQTIYFKNIKVRSKDSDGYVTTLYDQAGNNNHALQATAAYQPQLVSGGDLIKSGNHPAWEFTNSGSTFHNLELFGKLQVTLLDAWFVADTASTRYLYPADFDDSGNFGWVAESNSSSTSLIGNYGINADARLYVNNQLTAQHGVNSRGTISTALLGRKLVHHQNNGTGAWDNVMVGWYGGGQAVGGHRPYFYEGKMSEMIWYDSSQSSNRTSIDTAINTHYNIYS